MATIKTRKTADGATRYTAILRIRKGQVILHRESKTFASVAPRCLGRSSEKSSWKSRARSIRPNKGKPHSPHSYAGTSTVFLKLPLGSEQNRLHWSFWKSTILAK
jgi:hypothetical protein